MILVGSGNMATNLAYAFRKAGVRIDCVYSHQLHHAEELALKVGVAHYTDDLQNVNDVLKQDSSNQVVIYCLKDSVLPEVLSCIDAPDAIHLHTAGSMGITVFAGKNKPHCGVLYPFTLYPPPVSAAKPLYNSLIVRVRHSLVAEHSMFHTAMQCIHYRLGHTEIHVGHPHR